MTFNKFHYLYSVTYEWFLPSLIFQDSSFESVHYSWCSIVWARSATLAAVWFLLYNFFFIINGLPWTWWVCCDRWILLTFLSNPYTSWNMSRLHLLRVNKTLHVKDFHELDDLYSVTDEYFLPSSLHFLKYVKTSSFESEQDSSCKGLPWT